VWLATACIAARGRAGPPPAQASRRRPRPSPPARRAPPTAPPPAALNARPASYTLVKIISAFFFFCISEGDPNVWFVELQLTTKIKYHDVTGVESALCRFCMW
jgi:hypothetical protein